LEARQNIDQFNFLITEAAQMIVNDKADEDRVFKTLQVRNLMFDNYFY
jgi:hypothetical protein